VKGSEAVLDLSGVGLGGGLTPQGNIADPLLKTNIKPVRGRT